MGEAGGRPWRWGAPSRVAPMRAGFILCEIRRMRAGEGRGSGYLLERTLRLLCG